MGKFASKSYGKILRDDLTPGHIAKFGQCLENREGLVKLQQFRDGKKFRDVIIKFQKNAKFSGCIKVLN